MLIGIDANEANLTANRVGVNQYAFDLLHAIYNLSTEDNFVIYLKNPPRSDLPLPRPGWQYRVIPFPKLWTQTRLPWDLFTHTPRPDVFFSMTHYSPRLAPMPTVVAIMDLGFLKTPEQFTSKDFNQLKSWTKYSVLQAKRIVAISEHTKKDLIQNYGVNPSKVTVTYLGFDEKLFKPTKDNAVLKKYHITKPFFLFLGSLRPSKNVESLLTAFAKLNLADYQLVISGKKAWLYDHIFQLAKDLKLNDRVVFTGFIQESEAPVLMTHASAFVMPSFYEGFGIPVLEAMAVGCPVVVSRVASLPEVAGAAGIYIDPTSVDSLASGLITSIGKKRSAFIKSGLAQSRKFSWETCARQTLSVLKEAVQ